MQSDSLQYANKQTQQNEFIGDGHGGGGARAPTYWSL